MMVVGGISGTFVALALLSVIAVSLVRPGFITEKDKNVKGLGLLVMFLVEYIISTVVVILPIWLYWVYVVGTRSLSDAEIKAYWAARYKALAICSLPWALVLVYAYQLNGVMWVTITGGALTTHAGKSLGECSFRSYETFMSLECWLNSCFPLAILVGVYGAVVFVIIVVGLIIRCAIYCRTASEEYEHAPLMRTTV